MWIHANLAGERLGEDGYYVEFSANGHELYGATMWQQYNGQIAGDDADDATEGAGYWNTDENWMSTDPMDADSDNQRLP